MIFKQKQHLLQHIINPKELTVWEKLFEKKNSDYVVNLDIDIE